jgi:hypothetical protein
MSLQLTDLESGTFAEMDQKAREVIEKRFGVRLDSAQSSERFQAAWDVYQNATVKILKALANENESGGAARLQDPLGYATVIARNSCRDFWRVHNPGWAELKGRLSRFFRKQPAYAMWSIDEQTGSICGPAGWKNRAVAPGAKVSELIENPRRVQASYLPKIEVIQGQDAPAWARLLDGFFDYLGGPVRLDELVSIAGVFFGVRGSREMAFDELARGADGHVWDPPAGEPRADAVLAIREQLRKVWTELRSMPKRWVMPFLLNPPVMKGSGRRMRFRPARGADDAATNATSTDHGPARPGVIDKPDRGEIGVFPSAGIASINEIESLVAFKQEQYALLWSRLEVEAHGGPPLASVSDPHERFAVIWDRLPLEDEVIAAVMGLDSGQKVINLRMVAKNHLAKALAG